MGFLSLIGSLYHTVASFHVYELHTYPKLFFDLIFGAFLDYMEVGFVVFIIVLMIYYRDSYNITNDPARFYKYFCIIYNIANFCLQGGQAILFFFLVREYEPYGQGENGFVYPAIILIFSIFKIIVVFITVFWTGHYLVTNSGLESYIQTPQFIRLPMYELALFQNNQVQPEASTDPEEK